jgi:Terpene synthase family 2, C-terminal metal binding
VTAMIHRIEVPPFYCPIAPGMHPKLHEVEVRSIDWATAVGLCPDAGHRARLKGTKSAEFYAGMTPEGIEEHLEIAAEWVYWGFSFDDAWCDEGSVMRRPDRFIHQAARVLRILETLDVRLCSDDPHLLALHDLAVRYQQRATPVQMRRWVAAHRLWLFGVVQQNTHRAQNTRLDTNDYLAIRLHDCGGPPTQSMYEFVNGLEVPGHEMDSPAVRAITEAFWMIAAWDNDRVSRHKELLGQKDDYNIINVVQRQYGCSLEQATDEAIAMRDRTLCLFLRLRDQLMPRASLSLQNYLTTLGHGIRSNIDWSLNVPRYNTVYYNPAHTSATTRIELSGSCVDKPSDSSLKPPPFPSIAWWWEQLS